MNKATADLAAEEQSGGDGKSTERPEFVGNAANPDYSAFLRNECQTGPQVFIELTSVCNFHCYYCESPNHNRKTQITDENFYRLVDQLQDLTTQSIRFHCDGEPTVHKKFYEYSRAINERGMRISLASNGSNLQKRFLSLKMDMRIHLSTTAEEFKGRSTLRFERYLAGMRDYARAWSECDSEQHIGYNLYLSSESRRTVNTMNKTRQFVNDFLVGAGFALDTKQDASPNSLWFRFEKPNGYTFKIMTQNIASGGMYPETETNKPVSLPRDFGFCDSPWKRLVVLADGTLQPCCLDLSGSLAYTKPKEISQRSLSDLWNNDPRIEAIRQGMLDGKMKHPTCQKCLDRLPSREFYTAFQKQFE